MINEVDVTLNDNTDFPAYVKYISTYADGVSIRDHQLLKAGTTEAFKLRIEFEKNISNDILPNNDVSFSMNFLVDYIQADSNAVDVEHVLIYSNGEQEAIVDEIVPNGLKIYNTYQDAVGASNKPMFLGYVMNGSVIQNFTVGFVYDEDVYYLNVGGSTFDSVNEVYNNDSIYYDQNKRKLSDIFDKNCVKNAASHEYVCFSDDIGVKLYQDGSIDISTPNYYCSANSHSSICEEMGD